MPCALAACPASLVTVALHGKSWKAPVPGPLHCGSLPPWAPAQPPLVTVALTVLRPARCTPYGSGRASHSAWQGEASEGVPPVSLRLRRSSLGEDRGSLSALRPARWTAYTSGQRFRCVNRTVRRASDATVVHFASDVRARMVSRFRAGGIALIGV